MKVEKEGCTGQATVSVSPEREQSQGTDWSLERKPVCAAPRSKHRAGIRLCGHEGAGVERQDLAVGVQGFWRNLRVFLARARQPQGLELLDKLGLLEGCLSCRDEKGRRARQAPVRVQPLMLGAGRSKSQAVSTISRRSGIEQDGRCNLSRAWRG